MNDARPRRQGRADAAGRAAVVEAPPLPDVKWEQLHWPAAQPTGAFRDDGIPREVLQCVAEYLPVADALRLATTCKFWHSVCSTDSIWRRRLHSDFGFDDELVARGAPSQREYMRIYARRYLRFHNQVSAMTSTVQRNEQARMMLLRTAALQRCWLLYALPRIYWQFATERDVMYLTWLLRLGLALVLIVAGFAAPATGLLLLHGAWSYVWYGLGCAVLDVLSPLYVAVTCWCLIRTEAVFVLENMVGDALVHRLRLESPTVTVPTALVLVAIRFAAWRAGWPFVLVWVLWLLAKLCAFLLAMVANSLICAQIAKSVDRGSRSQFFVWYHLITVSILHSISAVRIALFNETVMTALGVLRTLLAILCIAAAAALSCWAIFFRPRWMDSRLVRIGSSLAIGAIFVLGFMFTQLVRSVWQAEFVWFTWVDSEYLGHVLVVAAWLLLPFGLACQFASPPTDSERSFLFVVAMVSLVIMAVQYVAFPGATYRAFSAAVFGSA